MSSAVRPIRAPGETLEKKKKNWKGKKVAVVTMYRLSLLWHFELLEKCRN